MNPAMTFGFKLAELTQQNDSAGIGLIALAIKDAGKSPQQMGYQDFKIVFQDHLPTRLEKLNIPNREKIVGQMLQYLGQQQSLFTMTSA